MSLRKRCVNSVDGNIISPKTILKRKIGNVDVRSPLYNLGKKLMSAEDATVF